MGYSVGIILDMYFCCMKSSQLFFHGHLSSADNLNSKMCCRIQTSRLYLFLSLNALVCLPLWLLRLSMWREWLCISECASNTKGGETVSVLRGVVGRALTHFYFANLSQWYKFHTTMTRGHSRHKLTNVDFRNKKIANRFDQPQEGWWGWVN